MVPTTSPTKERSRDLDKMIEVEGEATNIGGYELRMNLTVGWIQYAKAGTLLVIHRRLEAVAAKTGVGKVEDLPDAVRRSISSPLDNLNSVFSQHLDTPASEVVWELISKGIASEDANAD